MCSVEAAQKPTQCKSDERGAVGSLSGSDSVTSLGTAFGSRASLGWKQYSLCTNARYTGTALTQITDAATKLGLHISELDFKGPEYWDDLCTKHFAHVRHRFDYRVTASEMHVVEALRSDGYFGRHVQEYKQKIAGAGFRVVVKNNRTPVEIEFPFSPDLSVENCLDVAKELLGISLKWTNFSDLGTSAGPSLSITIDQKPQGFAQKIEDLPLPPGEELTLWITIVWRDETKEDSESQEHYRSLAFLRHRLDTVLADTIKRDSVSPSERRRVTIARQEEILEAMIWAGANRMKTSSSDMSTPLRG